MSGQGRGPAPVGLSVGGYVEQYGGGWRACFTGFRDGKKYATWKHDKVWPTQAEAMAHAIEMAKHITDELSEPGRAAELVIGDGKQS